MSVSSCCSAELKVSYGSEGTGCYLCAKCWKPCDAVSERSPKDSDLTAQILRMENKKIGCVLADICKLLKASGVEKKYFDQADTASLEAENAKLKAEVERLGRIKGVQTSPCFCHGCTDLIPNLNIERDALKAEVGRLKRVMEKKS